MKNILHIASRYVPYIGGSAFRLKNILSRLKDKFKITLIVPSKDAGGENIYEESLPKHELIDDIDVFRCDEKSMPNLIKWLQKDRRFSLLHAHDTRWAFYGIWRAYKLPLVLEYRALKELSLSKRLFDFYLAKWKAEKIIILSNSERTKKKIANRNMISPKKIIPIINGVDNRRFSPMSRNNKLKHKLGLGDEDFVLGYTGTFYDWQGVFKILELAKKIKNRKMKNIKILMVGNGPEQEIMLKEIGLNELNDVLLMLRAVPQENIREYLSIMDLFLMLRPSTIATEYTVPLKILESLAMGIPVLSTPVGGGIEVLSEGGGTILPDHSPNSALEAVCKYIGDEDFKRLKSREALEIAKKYSWDKSVQKLIDIYYEIINSRE